MPQHSAYTLNHHITVKYNSSDGTTADDWQTFCTAWAAKKALKNRLFYEAAGAQSENDVVFTIHFRTGITPSMQIADAGQTYTICDDPVDSGDERQWLEIHARRIGENGS